jgi:hypothetical protein
MSAFDSREAISNTTPTMNPDLARLESALKQLKQEMTAFDEIRKTFAEVIRLTIELADLRAELRAEIATLKR